MIADPRGGMSCTDWDTKLPDVLSHPSGLERTLEILKAFVTSKDFEEVVRRLKDEDAGKLVDVLNQVCRSPGCPRLPNSDRDDQAIVPVDCGKTQNTPLLRALGFICSITTHLPCSIILSDGLKKCGGIAVASGGFTDIWRGTHYTKIVAIKAFRTYPVQDLKEAKKVRHNLRWKSLSFFDNPRRFCGGRWLCGRGYLIKTSCHSMVSTWAISNLRSSMIGWSLAILPST